MLIGINAILTPNLLHALADMGHGDSIVLVDANYPGSRGKRTLDLAGVNVVQALKAVLSLLPLDSFIPNPAQVMEVVGDPGAVPPVFAEMNEVLVAGGNKPAQPVERREVLQTARSSALVVQTSSMARCP